MRTALLVTNRRPGEAAGRAEKVEARQRLFGERGWQVEIAYVPEPYVPLFPLAVVNALRGIRRHDPDVVVSMNNPFHIHVVGYLASLVTDLPWVAEFRDPILTHPDWEEGSVLKRVAGAVEGLTVRNADRVCWLDGIQLPADYFERTYPEVPSHRFVKLPYTGYDPAKFEDVEPRTDDPFTITYAGSFYEGWIEPDDFLAGFGTMLDRTDAPVRAHFYGDWNERYSAIAEATGVSDRVVTHGFVPHDEVIPALLGSDVLLYVGGTDPSNRLNIPSKIWDYVAAERPILALVDPDFAVAEFIESESLGVVVHPDDHDGIALALQRLVDGEVAYDPDPTLLEDCSRDNHADAFTELLDDLVAETG